MFYYCVRPLKYVAMAFGCYNHNSVPSNLTRLHRKLQLTVIVGEEEEDVSFIVHSISHCVSYNYFSLLLVEEEVLSVICKALILQCL